MIDDGKKVTLTKTEYDQLMSDMWKAFRSDQPALMPPWGSGPREVYVASPDACGVADG